MTSLAPVMDASLPEQSLLKHLQDFLPMWLAELDTERGFPAGHTSVPKSWEVVSTLDLSLEPQYPAVFIVSPGMAEPPMREGSGTIRATWQLDVAVFVQG